MRAPDSAGERIAIVGGPRHGKSTLAEQLRREHDIPVYCCDPKSKVVNPKPDTIYLPEGMKFEEGAKWAAENWFPMPGPWVIEGHSVARSLRYLAQETKDPREFVDQVIVLPYPHEEQTDGQRNLSKGVATVWEEVEDFYHPVTEYQMVPSSSSKRTPTPSPASRSREKTIAVDFDGVIHDPYGAALYQFGDPIRGAFKFLQALLDEDFDIVIFTTRVHSPRQEQIIRDWFEDHGFAEPNSLKISLEKPAARLYIDDRGYQFTGKFPSIDYIRSFSPWNGEDSHLPELRNQPTRKNR